MADEDVTQEQLEAALEAQLEIQRLQELIDQLSPIAFPPQKKHEPLPEPVYTAPPARRYAMVGPNGRVMNVCAWAGPEVCDRCSTAIGGAESCPVCGRVQWKPPSDCRMVLAESAGNIGDRHNGEQFIRMPSPASPSAKKSKLELLADALVAKGVIQQEELDELDVRSRL